MFEKTEYGDARHLDCLIERGRNLSHRKVKRTQKKRVPAKRHAPLQTSRGIAPAIQFPRPDTNGLEQIIIVPEFALDDTRALPQSSPQGSQGIYNVTFLLSVPGKELFRDELDLNKLMQSGDSLLLLPQEAVQVNVTIFNNQEAVTLSIAKNARGALSKAQLRVQASSFVEAETNAFNIVMPLLSKWSYLYDVALDITGYQAVEEQTGAQKWTFGIVGKEKVLSFNRVDVSKPIYRTVFSAYREALNASNPFYRLLCF